MASVASLLIEEVTAHVQSDSLKDVGEICADSTYFPNNLRITAFIVLSCHKHSGNLEMKSSTIMVLQTNKQNSVLLMNFTVLFLCRKGSFFF